jgi:hypothetical protein
MICSYEDGIMYGWLWTVMVHYHDDMKKLNDGTDNSALKLTPEGR